LEPELPFITPEFKGIGGSIKNELSHFVVEELPLYEPSGQGEHLYLHLRREGLTTRDLQKRLADLFGLHEAQVGYAGLKDKQAVVTQTFSVQVFGLGEQEAAGKVQAELGLEVLSAKRHGNKLRKGHLLGNRFRVLVSDAAPDAENTARAVAKALGERGLPNYFGAQRFGIQGDNALRGRQILTGRGPRQRWLRELLLSAYQSRLFNLWLAQRLQSGFFQTLLAGDIAKKTDTGGLFTVEDLQAETPRLLAGEITYTGPIYGAKMMWPQGEAAEMERAVLAAEEVSEEMLKRAGLKGSRRRARLNPDDLAIQPEAGGLWFSFALPKGSYATTLLREFMKTELLEQA